MMAGGLNIVEDTKFRVTMEELGELINCENCGSPTYDRNNLPDYTVRLPDGITAGNRRMFVTVGGVRRLVCSNCRYDAFGAY
jgi:hypothetical protein